MTEIQRINSIEDALNRLIETTNRTTENVNNLSIEMKLSREKSALEMKEFKDEMKEFKDEMKEFKDYMKKNSKEMNMKWGQLANRLGTVVEDLIYPNLEKSIMQAFNQEVIETSIRVKKYMKSKGLRMELDAIALTHDTLYIVESKTTVTKDKVDNFEKKINSEDFNVLFPQYNKYKKVLIIASLSIDEEMKKYILQKNMYPMVFRDDLMEIVTK